MSMDYAYIDCGSNDDRQGLLDAFGPVGRDGRTASQVAAAINEAFDEAAEEGDEYPPVSDIINGAIIPAYEAAGHEVLVIDGELDNGYIVVVHY